MFAINDQVPGPTIAVYEGQQVIHIEIRKHIDVISVLVLYYKFNFQRNLQVLFELSRFI